MESIRALLIELKNKLGDTISPNLINDNLKFFIIFKLFAIKLDFKFNFNDYYNQKVVWQSFSKFKHFSLNFRSY